MRQAGIKPRSKRCRSSRTDFVPARALQIACTGECALQLKQTQREKQRRSFELRQRREIRPRKEKLKSRAHHLREVQKAVNEYIRWRDRALPCISCGRFHDGQWHAGHYRSVGGHPELRFEPLNIWRQCAPCNTHKSGDLVNYRIELVARIGADKVAWLEGPHQPKRHSIEDLKAIKAEYRAKTRDLKRAAA